MADHFCQFACTFNVRSAKNAAGAEVIRGELAAEIYREEGGYPGFDVQVDHELGPGALWIYSEEYGDPALSGGTHAHARTVDMHASQRPAPLRLRNRE